MGFGDAAMVAPLGEDAIAATTTGASNALNLFIFPMGLVFIVQSFVAQLAGRGDIAGGRRYAWYGLIVSVVAGLAAAGFVFALPSLTAGLGFTENVRALLIDYMAIRLFSCGAVIAVEVIGNWYGALGNTVLPMFVSFMSMVLDVFLNWVLIYGKLGAPAMGVQGAALSSAISSVIAFIVIFVAFLRAKVDPSKLPPAAEEPSVLDVAVNPPKTRVAEFLRMLRFGVPSGANWFLEFAAFTVFINVIVVRLGTTSVAAMMAVVQVNSIAFMPSFGVSTAGAILVGQAIGAGEKARVSGIVRRTMTLAAGWQVFVGVVYAIIPGTVMSIFGAADSEQGRDLVRLGATLLLVSSAWQLFDAIAISLSEALRAAGDTAWCMWARILLAWFLFLPLAGGLVIWGGVGPVGAIGCFVVYLAGLALMMVYRYRSGAWKNIDLTGMGAPAH